MYVVENWEFKDFHDKKFNSLRKALLEAARKFCDYTECNVEPEEDEEQVEASEVKDDDDGRCWTCGDTLVNAVCETCNP